jgi:hypothetical protein
VIKWNPGIGRICEILMGVKWVEKADRFPLGIVIIAVVMIFAGVGTASYWILRWIGKPVAETLPVGPEVYQAFVYPDMVLSVLLLVGAFGLLRLKKSGFVVALLALGMWLSDLLLILGLLKGDRIGFVGACFMFVVLSIGYLWFRKHLFL